MPESPEPKRHVHPRRRPAEGDEQSSQAAAEGGAPYAELHCLTNFSFLRGASHPEELVARAAELGYTALAITDRNSLAGVVRAHVAAKQHGLHLLIGAEITPLDAPPLVLLAPDRAAYGRLARLITRRRCRAPKGDCTLYLDDVAELGPGLIALVLPDANLTTSPCDDASAQRLKAPAPAHRRGPSNPSIPQSLDSLRTYRDLFTNRLYLAAELAYDLPDEVQLARLSELSRRTGIPLVAANHVHYHVPERRYLQDVLTCIREQCTLAEAGRRLLPNAERHLRPRDELVRRYAGYSRLLERTAAIAALCTFSLDELRYEYPHELCPEGTTPVAYLTQLTWAGARERYPAGIPEPVRRQISAELVLIAQLKYEHYFLTVWDLVRFARSRNILCQGRGSAANSAVCYCLGVTAVDPARIELLFERFISHERNEPPDIDVDFEHERREEVFQYIYQKYGRERAGITAEVITYRPRSAVRDVGKALGLSLDRLDVLAKALDWWSDEAVPEEALRSAGLDPQDRTVHMLIRLVRQLLGFPRHLSQHVGGFVITETPLCEIVPLENGAMPDRTFIEWDKDDIDALGILKVDCLALGMLTAVHKCLDLLHAHSGIEYELHTLPPEDPAVYDMICGADTVGVFQIESRAQMSMLPRLRPRDFYDLVIEVAIVRPGPIQGGMVHPYLRRRDGLEAVEYPSTEVRQVLEKTLGVPLFQEQVMRLAVVAAGFTPGEADQLRRAMAAWRRSGQLERFQLKLIQGMLAHGYSRAFAEQLYKQIRGFGEYGFPESHAASFALLVYASAWLKYYHPAAFCAALLNSQPLGFYTPGQLVRDALAHGVTVLPVDVNYSGWDCTLEEGRRDEGTKGRRKERSNGPDHVSQLDRLAEGCGIGKEHLSGHPCDAEDRAVWSDEPDASGRCFGGQQYRGGQCPSDPSGLPALPRCGAGLAGRVGNATDHCDGAGHAGGDRCNDRSAGRGGSPGSRPDSQPTKERPAHLAGSPGDLDLRPFVPSSLRPSLRLGFRLIRGLSADKVRGVEAARRAGPIRSLYQLAQRPDVTRDTLLRFAAADAFRSLGLSRREALWQILALDDAEPPLFAELEPHEPAVELPAPSLEETVVIDYDAIGFSLEAHPIGLVREELNNLKVTPNGRLRHLDNGQPVAVAGLVTVRQRPGTAKGIVFMTLEDETGMANLVIRPPIWERDQRIARGKIALVAEGHIERQGEVVHVIVRRLHDLLARLANLAHRSRDFH